MRSMATMPLWRSWTTTKQSKGLPTMFSKAQQLKRGYKPPKRGKRNQITAKEYEKAYEFYSGVCVMCGSPNIEMHHVKYRSQGGRGTWRNLMPLCKHHHEMAHSESAIDESVKALQVDKHGEHYYMDEHDLYQLDLIVEPTKEELEKYFGGY